MKPTTVFLIAAAALLRYEDALLDEWLERELRRAGGITALPSDR
jgi:hypothetical protein